MQTRKIALLAGLATLAAGILACTIDVGGPAYPDQHIPVSTEAVGEFQSAMQTAVVSGTDSGEVTLVITEPQLTSYIAYKLAQQQDPLFYNPQVFLRDGKIQIYGMARQGYFIASVAIVVTAGVDSQGQLTIELTSADFGPEPVPANLKDALTAMIQEAYTGAIGPAALGFRLESVTVANGSMTILGRTK
ncbi:MAG TPA: LmeA family phospholipid-binding protein [Anaerolineales bacterium]|nr:LmeA family phospholipid-binding protein [Anaerolineales bacterium]